MSMKRYSDRFYLDDDHIPACYGRSWEPGDEDCAGCQLRIDCRADTVANRNNKPKPRVAKISREEEPASTQQIVDAPESDNGIVRLPDGIMLMPTDSEGWGTTLGKNVASGALSACGYEVYRFFKRFKFRR